MQRSESELHRYMGGALTMQGQTVVNDRLAMRPLEEMACWLIINSEHCYDNSLTMILIRISMLSRNTESKPFFRTAHA